MRFAFVLTAAVLVLTACATATKPPPLATSPSPPSTTPDRGTTFASPVPEADAPSPLSISIQPDSARSFKQVAGHAPFTVTFGAEIIGGAPPYQVAWDFDGSGKTGNCKSCADESAQGTRAKPEVFVYQKPGEYEATVTVKDRTGQTATSSRRIVVIGMAQIPAWKYGVTAHLERRRAGYYPQLADVTRAAELMQSAGIQAARIDFNWDMLNPAEGKWDLQDYDAMVKIVRAHKLDILAILDYSSWWASSAQGSDDWRVRLYSEPRTPYDFASFAYQTVRHFKNDVHVWEIWNEPNMVGFWKPQPNAAHYTQLLQEAYLAVKYADPNAVVVFGGLAGNGVEGDDPSGFASNFIADAYRAGARSYFDVMAIHPYILPNSGIGAVRTKIAGGRAVLDQHGDTQVPLWITEIGAPSETPWWPTAPVQSEADVAAWLQEVYTHLWDSAPAIFWYDLQDQGVGDTVEQHFGLLRLDFSPKPAYDRYRGLTGGK
jgi:polysaccharide biosynthesis protein PslG